ncbi:MAG: DUF262 domain-containing protein [Sporomusaceae bacterium]|nr:DUF262 domain-containing protein [Sporomusaceae bacterium]
MEDKLDLRPVNELLGENFYIPYYQRGYRWTTQQVLDLLDDIWTFAERETEKGEFYCLQPVVVKERNWEEKGVCLNGWEVIDGQQRLTTIYIIISYLMKEYLKVDSLLGDYGKEMYTVRYQTRMHSESFLKNIVERSLDSNFYMSNIDFFHMAEAYNTVKQWFTDGIAVKDRTDRERFLSAILGTKEGNHSVQVIWYKVSQQASSTELFTRLNLGKIPLTNAELIKALFLSSASFKDITSEEQIKKKWEIAFLWDEMEQRLSDQDFWAFITNEKQSAYPNKIELLLDIVAGKREKETDGLYTFLYFLKYTRNNTHSLWDLWLIIEQYYQVLCEWYKDKNLYHKIGYLIAVGKKEHLQDLVNESLETRKDAFEGMIDLAIRDSVNFDLDKLSYDNKADHEKINNILLLFNIESIRSNESAAEKYPFKLHKGDEWSLEHIHAQNSEGVNKSKKEAWLAWLSSHKLLIEEVKAETNDEEKIKVFSDLIHEVDLLDKDRINWEGFNTLSKRIIQNFTEDSSGPAEDIHGISNLALLSLADNVVLNNSVFEVKRREIINMDRRGKYIPICTRRVFLKYYNSKPSTEHYYFWSREDRKNYRNEIETVLKKYLPRQEATED